MGNDDAKKLILARRAKFVAAALAGMTGVATACGGSTEDGKASNPNPCLGVECCPENPPEPCLSPPYEPPDADAAVDGNDDANGDADDAATNKDADAEPQPCLSPPIGDQ
jgi:hypothetical protein